MRLPLILLSSVFVLAACNGGSTPVRESAGQGFRQLEGMNLVINQAVTVPAGRARVFIQDGGADGRGSVLRGSFDQYRTHCGLEIRSVDHAGFTIQPGSFRIVQVQPSLEPVVSRSPLRVAGLHLAAGMDGPGSSAYHEGYHFWLASDSQPEVRRMSCYGTYAEPPDLHPPTLREIEQALGGIASFR